MLSEYGGEEDEVLWPHRPKKQYGEKFDAGGDGGQAEKGQTCNDLVPGFERMDQAGHGCCITNGDRSGKMARNHQVRTVRWRYLEAQIAPPDSPDLIEREIVMFDDELRSIDESTAEKLLAMLHSETKANYPTLCWSIRRIHDL